jgi:uncharacterized protein (TIGR00645 family)
MLRWLKWLEHSFEKALFASRWLLLPAYAILAGVLAVLTYKCGEEFWQLIRGMAAFDETKTILQALTIVDIILVLNLVLMVLFVGYTNFVSVFDFDEYVQIEKEVEAGAEKAKYSADIPKWMSHLDYSGLKVQLMGSIIAIAAVTTLRQFFELSNGSPIDAPRTLWMLVIFGVFLVAALIIAVINRLKVHPNEPGRESAPTGKGGPA